VATMYAVKTGDWGYRFGLFIYLAHLLDWIFLTENVFPLTL